LAWRLAVTKCNDCNAGIATVSSSINAVNIDRVGGRSYYVTGGTAALRKHVGYTLTALSYLAGSRQLTLHLQSPAAATAAQHAAEEAAAAAEVAATWQVYQVRRAL
jgi:hypothetical protein